MALPIRRLRLRLPPPPRQHLPFPPRRVVRQDGQQNHRVVRQRRPTGCRRWFEARANAPRTILPYRPLRSRDMEPGRGGELRCGGPRHGQPRALGCGLRGPVAELRLPDRHDPARPDAPKEGTQVFARLMDADYSRGRFVLALQDNGSLTMNLVAFPTPTHYADAYWATNTSGPGIFQLIYKVSGSIDLSYNSTFQSIISTGVPGDHYHRATLDPDGIFRQYVFPKNEPTTREWMVNQALATDICTKLRTRAGSGACGFNSYCTMGSNKRVDCVCPPNYSFIDGDRKYRGCKPNFVAQSCEPGGEDPFNLQEVDNLDWPLSDAEFFSSMNETECKTNCLKDCFCAVAIYLNLNGNCWKKKYPLSNGRVGNDVNRQAFIKYSTVLSSSARPEERRGGSWIWAIGASSFLVGSIMLNLALLAACLFVRSKRRVLVRTSSGTAGPSLCSFTYRELEIATKGFSEELGRGAFGTVYKGTLMGSDCEVLIAVKKLENMYEAEAAEKDFMNEIHTIGMTHHKNLVRLLGFCKEGMQHRLLVYEFMSNGSLNKFLFRDGRLPDWSQRVEIALGIARGLAYLHEECRTQIIHCDIKPHNILLDDNLVARISDFGLAKLLRLEQTRTSTGIRGTIGYFAPEWFKNSAITAKVDVYSFGVMLLEIVCCRKNLDWGYGLESEARPTLIDRAKECYRTGRLNDLLVEEDEHEEARTDGRRLERFVMVGLSCVQEEPWMRPSMKKVVQMLEGSTEIVVPPNVYSLEM